MRLSTLLSTSYPFWQPSVSPLRIVRDVANDPVTFVTYSLTGNQLNAAIVFSALQFFNVLRQPISRLPMIIAAAIDAVVALGRIGAMLRVSLDGTLRFSADYDRRMSSNRNYVLKAQRNLRSISTVTSLSRACRPQKKEEILQKNPRLSPVKWSRLRHHLLL